MHHRYLQGPDGTFTTFDPRLDIYLSTAINPAGAITGFYNDADGVFHGFVPARNGAILTLDPPDSTSTLALAINARGVITGAFFDSSGMATGSCGHRKRTPPYYPDLNQARRSAAAGCLVFWHSPAEEYSHGA